MAERTCTVEGCDLPHQARGWCDTHYTRWKRHRDPFFVVRPRTSPAEERFWSKVAPANVDECWIWTGSRSADGYGGFSMHSTRAAAHRWAYESLIGPIPDGLQLDHLCCNPPCVNPWHLDPVPMQVNIARARPPTATHCPQGHLFDEKNTYVNPRNGKRSCRRCRCEEQKARYRREKALHG